MLGLNSESDGDLLQGFFSYCARLKVKPIRIEFGCVSVKNDKTNKTVVLRLLKGVIEKGGEEDGADTGNTTRT